MTNFELTGFDQGPSLLAEVKCNGGNGQLANETSAKVLYINKVMFHSYGEPQSLDELANVLLRNSNEKVATFGGKTYSVHVKTIFDGDERRIFQIDFEAATSIDSNVHIISKSYLEFLSAIPVPIALLLKKDFSIQA